MSNKTKAIIVLISSLKGSLDGAASSLSSKTLDSYVSEGNATLLVLRKSDESKELDFFNQITGLSAQVETSEKP